jgi:hypothetical protein
MRLPRKEEEVLATLLSTAEDPSQKATRYKLVTRITMSWLKMRSGNI